MVAFTLYQPCFPAGLHQCPTLMITLKSPLPAEDYIAEQPFHSSHDVVAPLSGCHALLKTVSIGHCEFPFSAALCHLKFAWQVLTIIITYIHLFVVALLHQHCTPIRKFLFFGAALVVCACVRVCAVLARGSCLLQWTMDDGTDVLLSSVQVKQCSIWKEEWEKSNLNLRPKSTWKRHIGSVILSHISPFWQITREIHKAQKTTCQEKDPSEIIQIFVSLRKIDFHYRELNIILRKADEL